MSDPFAREPGQLSIDIWSDVVCPFCYMGETILSEALENFEHRDSVVVRYHSYQLMPELSADEPVDLADLLSQSKGLTPEQVIGMQEQLVARGTDLGIDYRFDQTQTINTRAAHRLTHFAQREGKQRALAQRLFRAYFTDGLNIGDYQVLAKLSAEVGLDPAEAIAVLEADEYAADVDVDIALAQQIGIGGVPFFVFNGKYAVSGAQPVEAFDEVLRQAWSDEG
ncbi:MAG: DsbA family oxidoreductase [Candidatus Nanopelagicales bacterium]|jgi:predicted DsbA family dithiol-disulfide isomerase